jgi:DNA-binding transcriptional LysR family regulator
MELRHLLYFKTVAEELHFRKAASRLFISQPPLSRQIRELEEELGVILFERNNKRVALTDAGLYFKKEVDALFSKLEESKNVAKQIHSSVSGELRIGYISSTFHDHLVEVLKEMLLVFPYVKTRLYEVPSVKQIKALEEGKLDVGIIRAPVNSEKVKVHTLYTDPFVLVSKENLEGLSLDDLRSYLKRKAFIFFSQAYAPNFNVNLVEICQRLGFYPEVTHETNNVHSILQLVAKDMGVSIVPASLVNQYDYLSIHFKELNMDAIFTEVVLVHNELDQNPVIDWFVKKYTALHLGLVE